METNTETDATTNEDCGLCPDCLAQAHRETALMVATSLLWAIEDKLASLKENDAEVFSAELNTLSEAAFRLANI